MLPDPYWPFFNPYLLACRDGSLLRGLRPTLSRVGVGTPLLSLAEARLHLKLDPLPVEAPGTLMAAAVVPPHPDDSLVRALVLAAQAEVDGWNSWTGRGVVTQQWRLSLRGFPSGPIALPLPPLKSVDAVSVMDDADGPATPISASLYAVRQSEAEPHALLYLRNGAAWPTLPDYGVAAPLPDAVQITFTTGYAAGHPDLELFKAYAKLRLGQLYENREGVVTGTSVAVLPAWENMLDNLRVSHPDFLK